MPIVVQTYRHINFGKVLNRFLGIFIEDSRTKVFFSQSCSGHVYVYVKL